MSPSDRTGPELVAIYAMTENRVIGKGGERLRKIGTKAREQMEKLFDRKVFLETWVRVRQGWSNDEAALRTLGYHD